MALRFVCDGCHADLPAHVPDNCDDACRACRNGHEGEVFGRYDPAHYCRSCATAWRAHDAAVRAERVTAIRTMESFIRAREADLKTTLRRLPD